MVYAFLKVWANWVLRIFFKKIYTSGIDQLPQDKALLIASNHPNGFLEPITMACIFPRPLHFLVRGDVFANPIARFWLEQTNQIPIFRFKDGFSELRKNNKSIEIALKKLQEKEAILIFVEGGTKPEKRLRPLQKGLARIAFQVLNNDKELPLDIVPVGINYLNNKQFRSESILRVGKPLSANAYHREYEDMNKGIRTLTSDIYDAMKQHVVHIDELKDTDLLNDMLIMSNVAESNSISPIVQASETALDKDKAIAQGINDLSVVAKEQLQQEVSSFYSKYDKSALVNYYQNPMPAILNWLLIILLAIPALLGLVINAVPFFAGKALATRKAKNSVFFMSLWLSVYAIVGLLFYAIGLILGLLFFGWKGLLILAGIPLFSISAYWWDRWQSAKAHMKVSNKLSEIKTECSALLNSLNITV